MQTLGHKLNNLQKLEPIFGLALFFFAPQQAIRIQAIVLIVEKLLKKRPQSLQRDILKLYQQKKNRLVQSQVILNQVSVPNVVNRLSQAPQSLQRDILKL